jgi:hypothetical protein
MLRLHGKRNPENRPPTKETCFQNSSQFIKKAVAVHDKKAVQKTEHLVPKHGTKLRLLSVLFVDVKELLQTIKHVTTKELTELVEAIANVNSKTLHG